MAAPPAYNPYAFSVTQDGIAHKDVSLALDLGITRPGAAAGLEAVRAAMPAAYNIEGPR